MKPTTYENPALKELVSQESRAAIRKNMRRALVDIQEEFGVTLSSMEEDEDAHIHLIVLREGLIILLHKLERLINLVVLFAKRLAQVRVPAFPTTLGVRACLWLQDLLEDQEELQIRSAGLRLYGLKLQNPEVNRRLGLALGFHKLYSLPDQQLPRKQDIRILMAMHSLDVTLSKIAEDLEQLGEQIMLYEPEQHLPAALFACDAQLELLIEGIKSIEVQIIKNDPQSQERVDEFLNSYGFGS